MPHTRPNPHQELAQGKVTTVQLLANPAAQSAFTQQLQAALGASGSLGGLIPGPGTDVFIIAQAVESQLRAQPALQAQADWEKQLRAWGALTVNGLTRDALFRVLERGAVVIDGVVIGTPKLPSPQAIPAKVPTVPTFLPQNFQGPYDWNLDGRGANVVAAWQMFAGQAQFAGALPWAGLRVAHLDTGYTEHAALGWAAGASPTVHPMAGFDYLDDDADPRDGWLPGYPGHGTRISAAIAGFAPQAAGSPFYGVAPGVGIVPFRVTDSVIVDHVKDLISQAIHQAVDSGCQVINISLGALFGSAQLARALDYAYERGVITVCAAGQVWSEVIYPGRYNRCITMGGVGPDLRPWRSAASGQYVDLCGPANGIRRVKAQPLPPGQAAQTLSPQSDGDGTSYATATCSGVAALWLAWHGVAALQTRYAASGLWQIPAAFKRLARLTATPGNWGADEASRYGSGVINAAALLAHALPADGSLVKAKEASDVFDPND
jgi:lambda repressor-like predicted transcriptional regulator